jgi:thymidine kinase
MIDDSSKYTIIMGAMGTGKTTKFKEYLRHFARRGLMCLVIQLSEDNRFDNDAKGNCILTHDQKDMTHPNTENYNNIEFLRVSRKDVLSKVKEILTLREHISVFGIDEMHFLETSDAVSLYEEIVTKRDKWLIGVSIDSFCAEKLAASKNGTTEFDPEGLPVPFIQRTYWKAHIIHLQGVCDNCKGLGGKFHTLVEGKSMNGKLVVPSGKETFQTVCRKCIHLNK